MSFFKAIARLVEISVPLETTLFVQYLATHRQPNPVPLESVTYPKVPSPSLSPRSYAARVVVPRKVLCRSRSSSSAVGRRKSFGPASYLTGVPFLVAGVVGRVDGFCKLRLGACGTLVLPSVRFPYSSYLACDLVWSSALLCGGCILSADPVGGMRLGVSSICTSTSGGGGGGVGGLSDGGGGVGGAGGVGGRPSAGGGGGGGGGNEPFLFLFRSPFPLPFAFPVGGRGSDSSAARLISDARLVGRFLILGGTYDDPASER